ncbi:uncharacterized protein ACNS7B_010184 isoform 3-T3 [Menidia menidia]
MDPSWPPLLVSAAVFVALLLLASVCLDCWSRGPQGSIHQGHMSEEYIPSGDFRLIPPGPQNPDQARTQASDLPSPLPSCAVPGMDPRRGSYTAAETASNASYENPVPGPESYESDPEDPGYLIVLPGGPTPTQRSRTSSLSSDHSYVNLESDDYLNVKQMHHLDPEPSSDPDSSSDSGDEGNYVNQPAMIHAQPSA